MYWLVNLADGFICGTRAQAVSRYYNHIVQFMVTVAFVCSQDPRKLSPVEDVGQSLTSGMEPALVLLIPGLAQIRRTSNTSTPKK